jgi:p-hydroxybenzoate 3-monooxygenase
VARRTTEVAIVGAGPAGLLLAHLLHLNGIDSTVLENRDEDYVIQRVRAGVLEQGTMDTLREAGVGERMDRQGAIHEGIELRYDGTGHRIDFMDLCGRAIMVYGQQEVVKDLIERRRDDGLALHFEVADVEVDPATATVRYTHEDDRHELQAKAIAGCDGFHGVCRDTIAQVLSERTREYPFGWLGILAEVAPSTHELIYASHERGFALHSLRSPELSRLYIQVDPHDDIENWPDERIWEELHTRFEKPGWTLQEGPIVEKGITPMRSFLVEPMQHERLYLAGDAAHIVPPTGAKGLNLAVADVRVLAQALTDWLRGGDASGLDSYSEKCLARVWRVQHFSWWMTSMLHRFPEEDEIQQRMQRAELDYVASSRAASTMLAENYTGLPYGWEAA